MAAAHQENAFAPVSAPDAATAAAAAAAAAAFYQQQPHHPAAAQLQMQMPQMQFYPAQMAPQAPDPYAAQQMQQMQFVQAAAPAVSQPPQYYIPNQSGYP